MTAQQILAVCQTSLTSSRQAEWYCNHLGFSLITADTFEGDWLNTLFDDARLTTLKRSLLALGRERVQLWEWLVDESKEAGVIQQKTDDAGADDCHESSHGYDLSFQHICIVTNDIAAAYANVMAAGSSTISTAIQTLPQWNVGAAGIQAVKFVDLQGHPLELLQFPADKGDPRWHLATDVNSSSHQLGLDHTAISISDTPQSQHFYVDLLGLSVAGGSLNHGIEQENLDDAKDALVQITSLRPADQGMGVEFLNYQKPTTGRPRPTPVAVTDLCDWRIILEVDDLERHHQLISQSPWSSSCGAITQLDPRLCGKSRGFAARDPDQHGLLLVGD
jgi:catechol 2,3-dioxygenase-like lactoylglutathione lyase family enzyme